MQVDVFSFSILFLEIVVFSLSRVQPGFVGNQFRSAGRLAAFRGFRPKPPKSLEENHAEVWQFIESMWSADPKKRPTFLTVCSVLETFQGIESSAQQEGPVEEGIFAEPTTSACSALDQQFQKEMQALKVQIAQYQSKYGVLESSDSAVLVVRRTS